MLFRSVSQSRYQVVLEREEGRTFAAALGVKYSEIKQMNCEAGIQSVFTVEGVNYTQSNGLIINPADLNLKYPKRMWLHTASTLPGASGSPIYQNGAVVGVHLGSTMVGGVEKNRFSSLLLFGTGNLVANKKQKIYDAPLYDNVETDDEQFDELLRLAEEEEEYRSQRGESYMEYKGDPESMIDAEDVERMADIEKRNPGMYNWGPHTGLVQFIASSPRGDELLTELKYETNVEGGDLHGGLS